jgi:transposase
VSGPEVSSDAELIAALQEANAGLRRVNAQLREVINTQGVHIEALTGQIEALSAQLAAQVARIAELERRLGSDSSNSSKPPSSDPPYRKPERSSSRTSSGRRPGKQPGTSGSTMPLVDDPNETIVHDVDRCGGCGADLTGAPISRVERRQVTDITPPPPPYVTEYQILTRTCPCCAATTCGPAPEGVAARAQYGPRVFATTAELTCAHYLPIGRATALLATLAGIGVSVGFVASVRGRASRLLEQTFLPRVHELLKSVGVLHADETPARAAKGLEYVHIAATEWLTAMHTGGRSKADIDNGGILPGFAGTLVRDGYAGYTHLTDALHAWCGAHILRDLAAFHRADPDQQMWAKAMADLLIDAHQHAQNARAAGADRIDAQTLTDLRRRYLGAYTAGIRDNDNRAGPLARDAATLARRFRDHQDMILRFVVDLAVPFTNNQAERDLRPVKIQQRTSGGTWRTLTGLADFAVVQSYLSTARKWGIDSIDALTRLFTTGAWLPPAAAPS